MPSAAAAVERLTLALGAPSARAEAELLLRHVLDCTRAELYCGPERTLSAAQQAELDALAARRRAGEPLQYLTGIQAFGPLELSVGPGVLVPRPETELVAQRAVELLAGRADPRVVDVGTGSGAIALFVAAARPDARVWATERSPAALRWARSNLHSCKLPNVRMLQADLFEGLPDDLRGACDLVVSNPPYLSGAQYAAAPVDVREHEPAEALVCGQDGLEVSRRLVDEAPEWLGPDGTLLLETGPGQAERLRDAMELRLRRVTISADLTGRPRIAEGSKP